MEKKKFMESVSTLQISTNYHKIKITCFTLLHEGPAAFPVQQAEVEYVEALATTSLAGLANANAIMAL